MSTMSQPAETTWAAYEIGRWHQADGSPEIIDVLAEEVDHAEACLAVIIAGIRTWVPGPHDHPAEGHWDDPSEGSEVHRVVALDDDGNPAWGWDAESPEWPDFEWTAICSAARVRRYAVVVGSRDEIRDELDAFWDAGTCVVAIYDTDVYEDDDDAIARWIAAHALSFDCVLDFRRPRARRARWSRMTARLPTRQAATLLGLTAPTFVARARKLGFAPRIERRRNSGWTYLVHLWTRDAIERVRAAIAAHPGRILSTEQRAQRAAQRRTNQTARVFERDATARDAGVRRGGLPVLATSSREARAGNASPLAPFGRVP